MSDKYKINDQNAAYFLTMTVVGWIDLFTRKELRDIIIDSLKYCQKSKGLVIFGFVLMPSHLHIICQAEEGNSLSEILRDFKRYTSRQVVKWIIANNESRKEWLLSYFEKACEHLKRGQNYKVWKDGNHAKEIFTSSFLFEKLEYIHNNPVIDGIVESPEEYIYSSARNYGEREALIEVVDLGWKPLTN